MPRFVLLQHDCPLGHPRGRHWDFMLEAAGALRTWALPEPPGKAETMLADALPDHRLAYLGYEGPVSSNRGHVARWDEGTYELVAESEAELVVLVRGTKWAGRVRLVRLDDDPQRWLVAFAAG